FTQKKQNIPNTITLKYYKKNQVKTRKIVLTQSPPDPRDFGIMFLAGLTLRYRKILYQEELTENLLFQMLENSDLPNKPEIKKYLRLLTLSETEHFGM
ncbi:MAG: hypothetical protein L3J56_08925, partial [Bacteroidales bacterium]|nr:hypothetical protein [Bacteroidales bacterium]